jgi:hypothetical protein
METAGSTETLATISQATRYHFNENCILENVVTVCGSALYVEIQP